MFDFFYEERIKERLRTSRRFARRMADQTMRDRVFIAVDLKASTWLNGERENRESIGEMR